LRSLIEAGTIHSWFFVGETGEIISGVGLLGLLGLVAAAFSTWLTSVRSLVNLA
jgi:hypothetical protein